MQKPEVMLKISEKICLIRLAILQMNNEEHPSANSLHTIKYNEKGELIPQKYHRKISEKLAELRDNILNLPSVKLHVLIPADKSNYKQVLFVLSESIAQSSDEDTNIAFNMSEIDSSTSTNLIYLDEKEAKNAIRKLSGKTISINVDQISGQKIENYAIEVGIHELEWLENEIEKFKYRGEYRKMPRWERQLQNIRYMPRYNQGEFTARDVHKNPVNLDNYRNMIGIGSDTLVMNIVSIFEMNSAIVMTDDISKWDWLIEEHEGKISVIDGSTVSFDLMKFYESRTDVAFKIIERWSQIIGSRSKYSVAEVMDEVITLDLTADHTMIDLVEETDGIEESIWDNLSTSHKRQEIQNDFGEFFRMWNYQDHTDEFDQLRSKGFRLIDISGMLDLEKIALSVVLMVMKEYDIIPKDDWLVLRDLHKKNTSDNYLESIDRLLYRVEFQKIAIMLDRFNDKMAKVYREKPWVDEVELKLFDLEEIKIPQKNQGRMSVDHISHHKNILVDPFDRQPTIIERKEQPTVEIKSYGKLDMESPTKKLYEMREMIEDEKSEEEIMDDLLDEEFERMDKLDIGVEEEEETIEIDKVNLVKSMSILCYLYQSYQPEKQDVVEEKLHFGELEDEITDLKENDIIDIIEGNKLLLNPSGRTIVNNLEKKIEADDWLKYKEKEEMSRYEILTKLRIQLNEAENLQDIITVANRLSVQVRKIRQEISEHSDDDPSIVYAKVKGLLGGLFGYETEEEFVLGRQYISDLISQSQDMLGIDAEKIFENTINELEINTMKESALDAEPINGDPSDQDQMKQVEEDEETFQPSKDTEDGEDEISTVEEESLEYDSEIITEGMIDEELEKENSNKSKEEFEDIVWMNSKESKRRNWISRNDNQYYVNTRVGIQDKLDSMAMSSIYAWIKINYTFQNKLLGKILLQKQLVDDVFTEHLTIESLVKLGVLRKEGREYRTNQLIQRFINNIQSEDAELRDIVNFDDFQLKLDKHQFEDVISFASNDEKDQKHIVAICSLFGQLDDKFQRYAEFVLVGKSLSIEEPEIKINELKLKNSKEAELLENKEVEEEQELKSSNEIKTSKKLSMPAKDNESDIVNEVQIKQQVKEPQKEGMDVVTSPPPMPDVENKSKKPIKKEDLLEVFDEMHLVNEILLKMYHNQWNNELKEVDDDTIDFLIRKDLIRKSNDSTWVLKEDGRVAIEDIVKSSKEIEKGVEDLDNVIDLHDLDQFASYYIKDQNRLIEEQDQINKFTYLLYSCKRIINKIKEQNLEIIGEETQFVKKIVETLQPSYKQSVIENMDDNEFETIKEKSLQSVNYSPPKNESNNSKINDENKEVGNKNYQEDLESLNEIAEKEESDDEEENQSSPITKGNIRLDWIDDMPNRIKHVINAGFSTIGDLNNLDEDLIDTLKNIKGIGPKTANKIIYRLDEVNKTNNVVGLINEKYKEKEVLIQQVSEDEIIAKNRSKKKLSIDRSDKKGDDQNHKQDEIEAKEDLLNLDQEIIVRAEKKSKEYLDSSPGEMISMIISEILLKNLIDETSHMEPEELIKNFNKLGSQTGVKTTIFTSNYPLIKNMWKENEDQRIQLMKKLRENILKGLRNFTYNQRFVSNLKNLV